MAAVRTKKQGEFNWLTLVQKGLLVLGIILVIPWVWKYIKAFFQSEQDAIEDAIADDPARLQDAMDDVNDGMLTKDASVYQLAAKKIYEAFNIPRHWYDWLLPTTWWEDDKAAYEAILESTEGFMGNDFDYMAECYKLISGSSKRDLYRDMEKYLDDKYKKLITW